MSDVKESVDEIDAPPLGRADRHRRRAAVQGDVFASADAHAELQAFQAIEPPDALPIHHPPLSSQQYPDAQESEPWPRVRELTDPQPQRALIPGCALAIPRRAAELSKMTGPLHADAVGRLKPGG